MSHSPRRGGVRPGGLVGEDGPLGRGVGVGSARGGGAAKRRRRAGAGPRGPAAGDGTKPAGPAPGPPAPAEEPPDAALWVARRAGVARRERLGHRGRLAGRGGLAGPGGLAGRAARQVAGYLVRPGLSRRSAPRGTGRDGVEVAGRPGEGRPAVHTARSVRFRFTPLTGTARSVPADS